MDSPSEIGRGAKNRAAKWIATFGGKYHQRAAYRFVILVLDLNDRLAGSSEADIVDGTISLDYLDIQRGLTKAGLSGKQN